MLPLLRHLVFVTSYRYKPITKEMYPTLQLMFEKLCKDLETEMVEFNSEIHNIYLLINSPKGSACLAIEQTLWSLQPESETLSSRSGQTLYKFEL